MMRIKSFSKSSYRLAGAVCLASLAAGCSSDASRFQDGLFTGTVPNAVGGSTVASAPRQAPTQTYPGDVSAQSAPVYDNTITGSVPRQNTPNTPVYVANAASQPYPAQPQSTYQSAVAQPVSRQPLRHAPPVQPIKPEIELAPVPVQSIATPVAASRSVAAQQPKAVRTVSLAPKPTNLSTSASAPDTIVTGSTPTAPTPARSGAKSDGWSAAGGTRVTIGPGETLYNLSRRYGVPAKEIMKANGISDPSKVDAGQVVVIPTYVYSRKTPVSAPDNNPKTRASRASVGYQGAARTANVPLPTPAPKRQAAVVPVANQTRQLTAVAKPATATPVKAQESVVAPAAKRAGVYSVQSGDSLSRIASRSGVSVDSLKRANGLTDSKIRIGQKLTIPSPSDNVDQVRTASVAKNSKRASEAAGNAAKVKPADNGATVAAKSAVKANAPKATGISKLRWPARGQVMNGFGSVEDGSRNDGIDISLPQGTPVKAAENGIVIYAGSGLKEYGNTVLVRHDNGLVSVYGHASELIVERGDNVSRGQVVALSGMSGNANRPKLHFEIRKDAKPVNPITFLE